MNLYQKLIEVQKAVSYLKKDNQGYQFKYVSSADTLAPIRVAMDEHGVLLMVKIVGHVLGDKETKGEGKQLLTELDIVFTWVNAEKPEEVIDCPFYAQGLDTGEKGVGKALTYAEKYFLLKFFHIATDKEDPDGNQGGSRSPKQQPSPKRDQPPAPAARASEPPLTRVGTPMPGETGEAATEQQLKKMHAVAKEKNLTREQFLGICGEQTGRTIGHANELTKREASRVIESLNQIGAAQ